MRLNVISLYDKLVKAYGRPIFTNTPKKDICEEYRRMIVQDPQKSFAAKDLEVYFLGTFRDDDCSWELLPKPEFLVRLEDYFPAKEVLKDDDQK